jgi:hypothetical protein
MLFDSCRHWVCHGLHRLRKPKMDETELKAKWLDFAKRLRPVGMNIFGATPVKITEQGSADIRIIGLMLLARTLSNLRAAIALTEGGFIVE